MDKELFLTVMTCDGVKDMIFQRSRAAMRWRAVNQAIDAGGESFAQRLREIPFDLGSTITMYDEARKHWYRSDEDRRGNWWISHR